VKAVWEAVAAPGTDPEVLAHVVGRLAGPHGSPKAIAREASALADVAPTITAIVRRLAPRPATSVREAAESVGEVWRQLGVRAAVVGDPAYPERLARGWPTTGGPVALAWRGPEDGLPRRPTVAIVGARRATPYGTGVASWLSAAAADAGCLVVSGGAVGIDAAAHAAALHVDGGTAVVIGCGHRVRYPRPHAIGGGLFDRVLGSGGWIVSELLPDVPPHPGNVLARNRIVAGLADAVVVVEGGPRSGSLRTAAVAAERGTQVLAVPGDVRAPGSAAPHRLLAEGAAPCASPEELLAAVTGSLGEEAESSVDMSVLPPAVRAELEQRWPRPVRTGELAATSGMPVGRLLAALTSARVAGEIAESPEGVRLRSAPSGRSGE
jgi:DNA processing protein